MLLSPSLLALTLLAAPATGSATEQDRMNAARVAFEADDFATAVRGFESLAHDFPAVAKYHYYAGLARENAGQDTHAYFHMQVFLASGEGTSEQKTLAAERAAALARRTTRVRLQLPDDLPALLRVTYLGPKSQATRPVIVVPLSALPLADIRPELALEPGIWELTIDPPVIGEEQVEPTTVEITAGVPTTAVRFKTSKAAQLPVTFDLDRKGLRKITVELRREGSTAPPIVLTTTDAKLHTTLPVGTWTYKASGRGLESLDGKFTLARPLHETLTLRSNVDDAERRRRRRLGLGLMGTGLITAAAGSAFVAVGVLREDHILTPDLPNMSTSNSGTADHFAFANTGLGLLGSSTGLWITAASSSIRRPRGWIPQVTIGALLTAAGAAWVGTATSNLPETYTREMPDPHLAFEHNPGVLASAFVLGLGAGLLGGASVGLLSTRKSNHSSTRASLDLTPGPRSTALTFRLAF